MQSRERADVLTVRAQRKPDQATPLLAARAADVDELMDQARVDELATAGYSVSSAYTMVKDPKRVNFSYRDNLWQGSDLLATGMESFAERF